MKMLPEYTFNKKPYGEEHRKMDVELAKEDLANKKQRLLNRRKQAYDLARVKMAASKLTETNDFYSGKKPRPEYPGRQALNIAAKLEYPGAEPGMPGSRETIVHPHDMPSYKKKMAEAQQKKKEESSWDSFDKEIGIKKGDTMTDILKPKFKNKNPFVPKNIPAMPPKGSKSKETESAYEARPKKVFGTSLPENLERSINLNKSITEKMRESVSE